MQEELQKNLSMPNLGNQTDQQSASVFTNYAKILLKKKWLIIISMMAVVIPATIWTFIAKPIYEAKATIIYEEANDTAMLLDLGQSFYSKSAILNMIEQINSRTLAYDVAKSLPEEVINSFKFPDDLSKNYSQAKFIGRTIRENLQVQNVRGGDIIKISVQANDPNAAKVIANSYVDHIIDWNIQKNRNQISSVRNFVEGQLSVFQDKLRTAEQELVKFKEQNKFITLSDESSEVLGNLTEAELAYNEVKAEREALEQRHRFIEKKKQELMPSLVVSSSEHAQQIKEELLNLEMQYSSLRLKADSEDEKKLISIRDKINSTKQDLIDELMRNAVRENLVDPLSQIRSLLQESITLEVDLETYKAREQALKKNIDRYTAELQVLPKQELELARLIRTKEVNDKIYAILLEKLEEARITEAGKVGDVRVIDYAEAPIDPIKPQKRKIIALALFLGLFGGIGVAFFLNSVDTSMKSEQDIEQYLNLPVLASIPKISTNGRLPKISNKDDNDNLYYSKLLPQFLKKSHIVEAYRTLQLNFAFLNPDKSFKTILITSAAPGEGKTLTSLNIAQLYARAGTKTLIMDCDLRRPMVHKGLNIDQEPGLTNLLIDKSVKLESCIQVLDDEDLCGNLAVIACGLLPPNPSELLSSKRMKDVLAQVQDKFELIFIDAPPVISVNDAMILGQKVDGALLVLRSGKINRDAAIKATKMLNNGRINIAGALLNDVDLKHVYAYYKDYYYYSNKKEKNVEC